MKLIQKGQFGNVEFKEGDVLKIKVKERYENFSTYIGRFVCFSRSLMGLERIIIQHTDVNVDESKLSIIKTKKIKSIKVLKE